MFTNGFLRFADRFLAFLERILEELGDDLVGIQEGSRGQADGGGGSTGEGIVERFIRNAITAVFAKMIEILVQGDERAADRGIENDFEIDPGSRVRVGNGPAFWRDDPGVQRPDQFGDEEWNDEVEREAAGLALAGVRAENIAGMAADDVENPEVHLAEG